MHLRFKNPLLFLVVYFIFIFSALTTHVIDWEFTIELITVSYTGSAAL